MSAFQVVALSTDFANRVRTSLQAPQYKHPAHVETATGYGPCRHCLNTFQEGRENRVLFTYNPFQSGLTPLPGPVFIHEKDCTRFAGPGLPPDFQRLPLLLEGYNNQGRVVTLEKPALGTAAASIADLLANQEVAFIHIRNAEAGCFMARVERVL
ncbi:MAG: DUF1203 domain-containing protein [Blastocatellia bacterium]|nr:DUF1203 domain-containing protein [Blastocatellia bacterium]